MITLKKQRKQHRKHGQHQKSFKSLIVDMRLMTEATKYIESDDISVLGEPNKWLADSLDEYISEADKEKLDSLGHITELQMCDLFSLHYNSQIKLVMEKGREYRAFDKDGNKADMVKEYLADLFEYQENK